MRPARIFSSAIFLLVAFVLQEAAISRINFPIAGFSLYIAVLVGLISLEDRTGAVVVGFIGGLLLDLSPTIDSPFGQWAFVMTLVGFFFSINRESLGDFASRPAVFIGFISIAAVVSMAIFLGTSALLGESNGSLSKVSTIVLGNGFWTLLFSPIILPILARFRNISLSSRDRI